MVTTELICRDPRPRSGRCRSGPRRGRAGLHEVADAVPGRAGAGGAQDRQGRGRGASVRVRRRNCGPRCSRCGADAGYREERYAAIDLTGLRLAAGDSACCRSYEEIIRTGAWWDLVDGVAHRLGALLQAHRAGTDAGAARWSTDEDFWFRRASITAQLGAKAATDTALLAAVIEANLADREFFIRKAIGWALREYAKTDPGLGARLRGNGTGRPQPAVAQGSAAETWRPAEPALDDRPRGDRLVRLAEQQLGLRDPGRSGTARTAGR